MFYSVIFKGRNKSTHTQIHLKDRLISKTGMMFSAINEEPALHCCRL